MKDSFSLHLEDQLLPLSQKWVVFYTLLAVHSERHVSTDEVCDYHPWSRLSPDIAGRDLWRFTCHQEEPLFGGRITSSPARQATKLFTLTPQATQALHFIPSRPILADQLRTLRNQRNQVAMQLGECTLLLQSGLVNEALLRLNEMRAQILNVNETAHLETLITMCLDEYFGTQGSAQQLPILQELLLQPGLNRLGRARLLIRLARHATMSAQYSEAKSHFVALRSLLSPEDGVEFCWYHINYGLYLRRTGNLDQAFYHQRLAHDAAQVAHWWQGLFAARYNLSLMHLTAATQSPELARKRHHQQALEWATKAYDTAILTRQVISSANASMLIAVSQRHLENYALARHWLENSLLLPPNHPNRQAYQANVYNELAWIEEACGNHFLAQISREQAAALQPGGAQP